MTYTTPPRLASHTVAPHEGQNVKVILDAFGSPTAAAKHEDAIGRLMVKTVRGKPKKEYGNGRNKTRIQETLDFCKTEWRNTKEIAAHLDTHIETVRKLTKAMHENAKLERKKKTGLAHLEYLYRSRRQLDAANEKRKNARYAKTDEIVAHCTDWKSSRQISDAFGLSQSNARRHLKSAIDDGRMERKGEGNNIVYRRLK